MTEKRTLIIGVGNPDRGDDGAALAVASRLRERLDLGHDVRVIQHWGESTGLVDAMTGWDEVLIIDAACSGSAPGSYRTFEVRETGLPSDLADMSSHGFGVPQAIELSRALGTLPARCRIYAIEGETLEAGAPLSDAVRKAVETVAQEIMQSLEAMNA
ncbi:MAG: hydrogenase maturation protease [Geminicoccaceae bacterium]